MRREFLLQDASSNKFWTIEVVGCETVTTNGRIGTKPRETRKTHASEDAARLAANQEIVGKRKKGYVEGAIDAAPERTGRLPPKLIRIDHDDYHAKRVGKTADGRQFFLTSPFAPQLGDDPGGNWIALYLFDAFGALLEARIANERKQGLHTETACVAYMDEQLASLGKFRFCNIKVAPFSVEFEGREFGLIFDPDDEIEDDDEAYVSVTVQPGDYMAFTPPWDGEYDT